MNLKLNQFLVRTVRDMMKEFSVFGYNHNFGYTEDEGGVTMEIPVGEEDLQLMEKVAEQLDPKPNGAYPNDTGDEFVLWWDIDDLYEFVPQFFEESTKKYKGVKSMKLHINEGIDSSIPQWLKKELVSKGYNGVSGKIPVDSVTYTPRGMTVQDLQTILKGDRRNIPAGRAYVFRLRGDYGERIWIYPYQEAPNMDVKGRYRDVDKMSAKTFADLVTQVGILEWDAGAYQRKKRERRDNKPFDRNRYKQKSTIELPHDINRRYNDPPTQGPPHRVWSDTTRYGDTWYDKSGYPITGLDKYKDMLAEMGFKNLIPTLADAYDTYTMFTSYAPRCMGKPTKIDVFSSISRQFLDMLSRIEREYEEYKQYAGRDSTWASFNRKHIEQYLRELRKQSRRADTFMDLIDTNDDDEVKWRKLDR